MLAVADNQGIESTIVPMVASGFCSGLARTAGICGAVTGAVMALGLLEGRTSPEQTMDPIYDHVQQLMDRFQEKFGSLTCGELTGVHLGTPEGQQEFKEKNQIEKCGEYVAEAVRLVYELAGEDS